MSESRNNATLSQGGGRANELVKEELIVPRWRRVRWQDLRTACGLGKRQDLQQHDLFLLGEQEAMRDIDKPIEQLLADIHEQGLKKQDHPKHLVDAIRRMSSMMAKVAISNQDLEQRLLRLTWVIVALTSALLFLTLVLVAQQWSTGSASAATDEPWRLPLYWFIW